MPASSLQRLPQAGQAEGISPPRLRANEHHEWESWVLLNLPTRPHAPGTMKPPACLLAIIFSSVPLFAALSDVSSTTAVTLQPGQSITIVFDLNPLVVTKI